MSRVRLALIAAALVPALALVAGPAGPAGAVTGSPQGTLVATVPTALTPNVNNGVVLTMVQVGTRIIVGGSFTSVSKELTCQFRAGSCSRPSNLSECT